MTARALICLLWLAPDKMTARQLRAMVLKHMEKNRE
jgi:hypothetical protein